MKMFIITILLAFILTACDNSTDTGIIINQITLKTEKSVYTAADSIKIVLENSAEGDISFGLRCNHYLEMEYQKKEGSKWSDNKSFWYLTLKCATFLYTLKPQKIYYYKTDSKIFDGNGIFRIVFNYNAVDKLESKTIYSNEFEIK
jgi:hypothetical protein